MNNGKICVSVCAETADEFIEKIKRAAQIADIVELRFDCINEIVDVNSNLNIEMIRELFTLLNNLSFISMATFRPSNQGGNKYLDKDSHAGEAFFHHAQKLINFNYIDNEYDAHFGGYFKSSQQIRSFHDYQKNPKYLEDIYEKLSIPNKILKLAIQANEITDTLAVWNLLKKAKSENKQLIPIAMGEAGKWTRILGLAYGSPITYASLESGNETAPGQISAMDLIEVYRVKELNKQTELYGIIGNSVSHSLSPYMHNAAFKHHNLNAVYIPFEVQNLDEFIKRMVREETREIDWNLKGFSVTIPHKEAIIKHLDFIDEDAAKIGAVNTVKIIDKRLCGYNTDADGFIEPLRNSYGDLKDANVGIIGNGGAARACVYALKKEGANVTIFARNTEKAKILADEFNTYLKDISTLDFGLRTLDCLVNTTPLGMKDSLENQTPATADQLKNIHIVYDLVYNPFETLFMREAKSVDVPTIGGLAMLVAQGMKQFEIWTDLEAPMKIMSRAALQRLK